MSTQIRVCEECEESRTHPFGRAEWVVTVMGSHRNTTKRLLVCAEHAEFYLERGPDIYPAERLPA